jgi:hypothetical protein
VVCDGTIPALIGSKGECVHIDGRLQQIRREIGKTTGQHDKKTLEEGTACKDVRLDLP